MKLSYVDKLKQAQERKGTNVALLLRPFMSEMPAPMHYHDDPFFPFSKSIINATRDVVCGYVFDFAAYMAHGAAGAVALERSMAFAGNDVVKVLHGTFSGERYINMVYDAFGADAATIASERDYEPYTADALRGVYVVQWGDVQVSDMGVYWVDRDLFTLLSGLNTRMAGESVLYAGYQHDFAEQCRAALEAMR